MAAVFGLLASMTISTGEVFGRRMTREVGALVAACLTSLLASVITLVLALLADGSPTIADMVRGAVSGLGFGLGIGSYLTGLRVSSSSVIAPTTAAVTAIIPYTYASIVDTPPTAAGLAGVVAVVAGIVLITAGGIPASNVRQGLPIGVLGGVGYGVGTSVLVDVSAAAGGWPLVSQRLAAFVAIGLYATWRGQRVRMPRTLWRDAGGTGVAMGLSSVFLLAGLRVDAPTTAVTGNLYPASSVVAGRLFFRDPVSRQQVVGLLIVLAGIVAIVTR